MEINITDISPIENALKDVETKTRELTGLEHRYRSLGRAQSEKKPNTNVLSMALNSVVDAPIDQGVPMYRAIFLESDYLLNNSGQGKIVHALSSSIDELVSRFFSFFLSIFYFSYSIDFVRQILTIARCLNLHGALCRLEMQPFVSFFFGSFSKTLITKLLLFLQKISMIL